MNNIIDKEKILAEAKKLQIKPGQKINLESMAPYIKEEFMDIDKFSNIDPLQKFQINMDPKGKYISIYDRLYYGAHLPVKLTFNIHYIFNYKFTILFHTFRTGFEK